MMSRHLDDLKFLMLLVMLSLSILFLGSTGGLFQYVQ